MKQEKIDRINELAKKAKEEGLTEAEKAEQQLLRREYLADVKKNAIGQLDCTYLVDEDGHKRKLERNPRS